MQLLAVVQFPPRLSIILTVVAVIAIRASHIHDAQHPPKEMERMPLTAASHHHSQFKLAPRPLRLVVFVCSKVSARREGAMI